MRTLLEEIFFPLVQLAFVALVIMNDNVVIDYVFDIT